MNVYLKYMLSAFLVGNQSLTRQPSLKGGVKSIRLLTAQVPIYTPPQRSHDSSTGRGKRDTAPLGLCCLDGTKVLANTVTLR